MAIRWARAAGGSGGRAHVGLVGGVFEPVEKVGVDLGLLARALAPLVEVDLVGGLKDVDGVVGCSMQVKGTEAVLAATEASSGRGGQARPFPAIAAPRGRSGGCRAHQQTNSRS